MLEIHMDKKERGRDNESEGMREEKKNMKKRERVRGKDERKGVAGPCMQQNVT